MGKPNAPSAPDPYASAAAQYQYGTQSAAYNAALNRVDSSNPTSSTNYAVTGTDPRTGAPLYQQTTQLSAPQQQLLTTAQGQAQAAQDQGLPNLGDLQHFGDQARQAAYGEATATMDPYWSQSEEQLDASLRNSGAHPGDPAYDNAMKSFRANRSAAYGQAENQAFGQGLAAQGTELNQLEQERSIPLNEIQALTGGSQVGSPAQAQTAAPDIMQAFQNQYQGQLAGYNANVSSSNATTADLTSLAVAALMFY